MDRWLRGGGGDEAAAANPQRQVNVHHIIVTDRQPSDQLIPTAAKKLEREVGILINSNHR